MVICPYCHDDLTAPGVASAIISCGHCFASHHSECWYECGRCASCRFTTRGAPRLSADITIIRGTLDESLLALTLDLPRALTWDIAVILSELLKDGIALGSEILSLSKEVAIKIGVTTISWLQPIRWVNWHSTPDADP